MIRTGALPLGSKWLEQIGEVFLKCNYGITFG